MRRDTSIQHFDSANIAESYSGIVLPLTASFARMVYAQVYADLLRMSGVSRKKLEAHAEIFENLLGFFYGRMYYRMNNWYRMAEFVPGYRRNKENFELMITSNLKEEVPTEIHPSIFLSVFYPFVVAGKVAMFGYTSRIFRQNVTKHLHFLRSHDFDRLGYEECIALFRNLNEHMLRRWYVTLENDFFVMTYLGILKRMLPEAELQRALVFPSKATEQVAALASLAKDMSGSREVWEAVEEGSAEAFEDALRRDPALHAELERYLHEFGGRFANELKLESVGVDEDRRKLFDVLKAYQKYEARAPVEAFHPKASYFKGLIVRTVLRKFKKYASRREEFRLLRSNTFAMVRHLFRRMGRILVARGMLLHADDVFYLELDELLAPDTEKNTNLHVIVRARKQEFTSYGAVTPPSHFSAKEGELPAVEMSADRAAHPFKAHPASPGVARGKVRIFREFSMPEKIDFDILVTSHTDPGWTALIALSKGLIIEHGGVLSHASIVARELGIPAVIGATGAMDMLRDYQMVEIDGAAGTITLL